MRILVLSDIHDRINKVKKIISTESFDIMFICGDITNFRPLGDVVRYIKLIRSTTEAPTYFVPGNCDPIELLENSFEDMKFYNVHRRVVELGKLQIAGIGGSGITPFATCIEFSEQDFAEMLEDIKTKLEPQKPLLFITHNPPYETTDFLYSGEPVGSATIRSFIENVKPLAVFSGHVHEGRGVVEVAGSTVVINPGPAAHGFFAVVDIEDNKVFAELKSAD
ncbi:MAG: metallophosphoesterase [Candidatus Korarchaeota archaeon]|nr:metallophosphoesterase [Thermoproteota archaeon]MCR8473130.1 metallophosphoesterase [Thermoproteota archaeon]